MIRKVCTILLAGMITFSLGACGQKESAQEDAKREEARQESEVTESPEEENSMETEGTASAETETASTDNHILIAYFSVPEDINTDGIDADAGASVVVRDGETLGNVQFMAETVQETIGGDLFRIETTQQYPLDHDPLVDQAAEEQDADARPELATHIENLEQYDTVILGYPNWWGDMPQPLYTFLEEYDFSGKTIIPFCPHGGSGFSQTEDTIAKLQPNAQISSEGLTISRNEVADSADEVTAWAESLGL